MLQTERLLIRPAQPEDAKPLFEVYGDAETMRYWDTLPDTDADQTARRVGWMVQMKPTTYFVLEHDGTAIGNAGIHSGEELGFILHRAHWRKGLMSEALGVLIPWCFETLPLAQMTADVDPRNTACIALLTELRFVETGRAARTIKVGDAWCDSVYFALPRP